MAMHVRYVSEDGIARVTLARPEVRNALGFDMLTALSEQVDRALDDAAVRLLVLDAEGPAFCAGMDLKSVDLADPQQAARFASALSGVYLRLMTLPKPFLCAVDGPVSGGGVGLAAAADLVWAGPLARFSLPETRLGLVPALVSVVVRRRAGPLVLSRMALGGISLDGQQAVTQGLVDFYAEGGARATAEAFIGTLLADHAPGAWVRTKRFLVSQTADALERQLGAAAQEFRESVQADEARRGLDAFRSKEFVRWDNR
jgi:methylglutaconyl-CoA hydratase